MNDVNINERAVIMGHKSYAIDRWGLGERVAELSATGAKGRVVAKEIYAEVERACRASGQPVPSIQALTVQVDRYMTTDPADRRTKKAHNQEKVKELQVQAVQKIITAQVDAAETLQRYVKRIDEEVARIAQVMEVDAETGRLFAPSFKDYYSALASMSKEMRGWITLLVDIKDRLWQHQQYEDAYSAILAAVKAESSPAVQQAISARLKSDPKVAAALRGMGGGA